MIIFWKVFIIMFDFPFCWLKFNDDLNLWHKMNKFCSVFFYICVGNMSAVEWFKFYCFSFFKAFQMTTPNTPIFYESHKERKTPSEFALSKFFIRLLCGKRITLSRMCRWRTWWRLSPLGTRIIPYLHFTGWFNKVNTPNFIKMGPKVKSKCQIRWICLSNFFSLPHF